VARDLVLYIPISAHATRMKEDTTDMEDVEKNEKKSITEGPAPTSYSGEAELVEAEDSDRLLPKKIPKGGFPHLDITRIVCVMLVAIDHGSPMYSEWNVIYVQQWTLQWIVLVSGVSFCLSSKPLLPYLGRLAIYAAVGIMVNWSAWIATGQDWEHDFFNVVFQMWFIVGLMLFCTILAPLKYWLKQDATQLESAEPLPSEPAEDEGVLNIVLTIVMALLFIGLLCVVFLPKLLNPFVAPIFLDFAKAIHGDGNVWGLPSNLKESQDFVAHLCTYAFLTLSNLFLLRTFRSIRIKASIIPWMIMANTLVNRSLMYRGPEERPFHLLDIMILGMVTQTYGLMYRKTVGEYYCRYWFVLLIGFALTWPPYLDKRLDMYPTFDRILRCKAELMETLCILGWLAASDRFFSREIFTVDRLGFLNDWALLVFLVHKAMHIIFGLPYSWIVLLLLIPVCGKFRRRETM